MLTRQEILDYALRYIGREEVTDFPIEGELFCFIEREVPAGKVLKDDEGWRFAGYQVCTGYVLDDDSKPVGKWVWMNYLSLESFPPQPRVVKLQPPHVVKGQFQNDARTRDIRILKIPTGHTDMPGTAALDHGGTTSSAQPASAKKEAKIFRFPSAKDDGPFDDSKAPA
jgi:hypothetical protein